ncbi:MAG: enoyl-CoA hydratase/isomerase family protein [Halieaceae bacterium]|jgi:2-(1,2-epoxy-1,2-dihydrophenyl)acetyl-CoA isomerase|nr:enoyl-CoA hydratase/isomerase family protein [Halieaceae bacterium]
MSNYDTVQVERRGSVAIVSLNRPDSLNAFNAALRHDLRRAVRQVNDDPAVLAVILTGAGRAFCAGADLAETAENPEDFRVEDQLNGEYKPMLLEMNRAGKPWIAAVNGAAAGIGSAFALNCDLVVMAENAYIYQAFAAIGLVPDGGATWHLVRTLGRHRAYEVIVSGEKVRAQKCLDWGLCNRVVPEEELLAQALAWAQELSAKSPLALRYAKQALNAAMEISVAETISYEAGLQHLCVTSEDAKEGVAAFVEKRAPRWQGR